MDHHAFAQLLGNYGEFVGAFAVVATLVYLAVQIKSARMASEASHIAVSGQHSGGVRERFIENAELWIKGNSGGELSPAEQFAFDQLVESMAEVHFFAFVRTRTHRACRAADRTYRSRYDGGITSRVRKFGRE